MTDATELLARLKELLAKATPGEWRVEDGTTLVWGDCNPDDNTSYGMGVPVTQMRSDYRSWGRQIDDDERTANAALIVAAVNAVPVLAAEIERLRAENAKLRADLKTAVNSEVLDGCEGCSAPLFEGDDYLTGDDCSGCWRAVSDADPEHKHPCYAYRVEAQP